MKCEARDHLERKLLSVPCFTHRFYRVIPASLYLEHFASDRQHMKVGLAPVVACRVVLQAVRCSATQSSV